MRSPFKSSQVHFIGGARFLSRFLRSHFPVDFLVDHRCRLTGRPQLVDRHNVIDSLAHGGLGRLLALGETLIEHPADDARIGLLGVSDLASLVDLLFGQPKVYDTRSKVRGCDFAGPISASALNLAPLLRGVVLIGEPLLGECLDLKRVSLSAMHGGDQIVMRALRLGEPSRSLGLIVGVGSRVACLQHLGGGSRVRQPL